MKKRNYEMLPVGYRLYRTIDMQHNKKEMLIVNLLAFAIMAVMVAAAVLFDTPSLSVEFGGGNWWQLFLTLLVLLAAIFAYVVLHELTHGILFRLFGGRRPRYGFTGMYAFAASDVYYCRRDYLVVGLAPVVLWGVVFGILCAAVPGWFWFFYFMQIVNLSGAGGDLYVTVLLLRQPRDVLVRDAGTSMELFTKCPPEVNPSKRDAQSGQV